MKIDSIPVVFLLGVGRCGGDLTRGILDWHDQVLIIPISNKFYPTWKSYKCDYIDDPDKIADIFLNNSKLSWFKENKFIHSYSQFEYDFSDVNWKIFNTSFHEYLHKHKLCARNVYYGIFYAYACACNKRIEKVRVIIADAFYDNYMSEILNDFSDARFIHIVRDHRANISSLKSFFLTMYGTLVYPGKGLKFGRSLFIHIINDYMVKVMRMLHDNKKTMSADYLRVIRFEDIKLNPKSTIEGLAGWLGIDFNECLMKLTKVGKLVHGNSSFYDQPVEGFTIEPVYRWKKHLRCYEIRMIEFIFGQSMLNLDYKPVYSRNPVSKLIGFICCFMPWKGEIFYMGYMKKAHALSKFKRFLRCYVIPFYYFPRNILMFFISRAFFLKLFIKGYLKVVPHEK
ncbi:sulfotransferase [candidate division KSB1 bacterium]|nr:sulfotransferase [candidate division KSB1 bacterium]